ncbi:hypothetical protein P691DRAFT_771494 [Macrolepiota fuliginosa MF-IS2]|uniref:Uncharacterized protein n=1 Tax=Macrolepiota fuliginosa MF-IS2 TaxID=1400762 RepID=A0A9P5XMP8_9AGAR|nr:hypothetical protein P691DRAFT_771494 [Macrolepiota fuliginosa MF-IS2]
MSEGGPLDEYNAYPFDTDQIYQQGLASILANGALANSPSTEEQEEILRRTRVFYFNKTTGNSITLDEARAHEQSLQQRTSQPLAPNPISPETELETGPATAQPEEPRVLTFAELKDLIEARRIDQIPNNKIISSALNEAPPSQSTAQTRRKPWEAASEDQDPIVSTPTTTADR